MKMSPHQQIKVNSGKPPFHKNVKMRRQNNWESFRHTKSVNRFTVVKDVSVVTKTTTLREERERNSHIKVSCFIKVGETWEQHSREVYEGQKKILCFGFECTIRADGNFWQKGKETPFSPGRKTTKKNTEKKKRIQTMKHENTYKTVAMKNEITGKVTMYKIIRKRKG